MTKRIFKSMMNRLPAGEYDAHDLWNLYQEICPKSYKDTSKWQNKIRFDQFAIFFEESKYGLVYMFDGKIKYVGTNDLHMLVVSE